MVRDVLVGDEAVSCRLPALPLVLFIKMEISVPHSKLVELEFLGWAQVRGVGCSVSAHGPLPPF